RILAGILLAILGVQQLRGRSIAHGLTGLVARAGERRDTLARGVGSPWLQFLQYGALYVLVAMPCVANVMAAPPLAAFSLQGLAGAAATEFVFLLTMAALMVAVSVLIGLANDAVLASLRASVPIVLHAASILLVAKGLNIVHLDLDLATFRTVFFHFPIR